MLQCYNVHWDNRAIHNFYCMCYNTINSLLIMQQWPLILLIPFAETMSRVLQVIIVAAQHLK